MLKRHPSSITDNVNKDGNKGSIELNARGCQPVKFTLIALIAIVAFATKPFVTKDEILNATYEGQQLS